MRQVTPVGMASWVGGVERVNQHSLTNNCDFFDVVVISKGLGLSDHLVVLHLTVMSATTTKQYKQAGEDVWKNRTEKIVRISKACE